MSVWHAFALQEEVPVSDTFCGHSQHCSLSATLFTHTHQAVCHAHISSHKNTCARKRL